MDDHIRHVYLTEAMTQCHFALNAIKGMNNVLIRLPDAARASEFEKSKVLQQEVFRSIHSFLTHLSNVSRLFWPGLPQRKRYEQNDAYKARCRLIQERGHGLRAPLGLPERHHPLKGRSLRDHLEHFDERLDDWQETSIRRNIVQDFIGPPGSISGIDDADMMRWFDPTTSTFRFRGSIFELQPLVTALEMLTTQIDDIISARWRQ